MALWLFHYFQVDIKVQGKTALQVASHQGFQNVVEEIIKAGANLEIKDDDGDSALHYAAFGWVSFTIWNVK